jgi:hypothetical protein
MLLPESVSYYAVRLLPEVARRFGDRVVPSNDAEFASTIYSERARLLGRADRPLTADHREFIKERLSRCGLETVAADLGSISEIWDIFDDYEFQEMMGRKP